MDVTEKDLQGFDLTTVPCWGRDRIRSREVGGEQPIPSPE
jgi:hypothetical protein